MSKKVVLACSHCGARNYTTMKSEKQSNVRLEINKFCKVCNIHTIHRETK
ncbi:50S ribosomal protein L33 [Sutcliffiella cohnii]